MKYRRKKRKNTEHSVLQYFNINKKNSLAVNWLTWNEWLLFCWDFITQIFNSNSCIWRELKVFLERNLLQYGGLFDRNKTEVQYFNFHEILKTMTNHWFLSLGYLFKRNQRNPFKSFKPKLVFSLLWSSALTRRTDCTKIYSVTYYFSWAKVQSLQK